MKRLTSIVLAALLAVMLIGCNKNTTTTEDPTPPYDPLGGQHIGDPAPDSTGPGVLELGAATPPPVTPTARPAASPNTHVVRRGDTLWSIAAHYYGDGKRWRDIASANNISNAGQLRVGATLVIP